MVLRANQTYLKEKCQQKQKLEGTIKKGEQREKKMEKDKLSLTNL